MVKRRGCWITTQQEGSYSAFNYGLEVSWSRIMSGDASLPQAISSQRPYCA